MLTQHRWQSCRPQNLFLDPKIVWRGQLFSCKLFISCFSPISKARTVQHIEQVQLYCVWWFQGFFNFHPKNWGNDPIWRFAYFSNGLVQPATSVFYAHTQFKQLAQPNGTIAENLGNNELNGEALARQGMVVGTVASNRLPFHQNTCERKRSKIESVWYLVELWSHHENLLTLVTSLEWVWGSYGKTSKRSEILYWGFSATNIKCH